MERLAAETESQREARLDQMSAVRSERLAAESSEQRDAIMQIMTFDFHTSVILSLITIPLIMISKVVEACLK